MRAPGWSRHRALGLTGTCLLNVAPDLISECDLLLPLLKQTQMFIRGGLKSSATFLIDMFLVHKEDNPSRKNTRSLPHPLFPMTFNEAIFILDGGKCSC